jgi:hypothetical protein
MAMETETAGEPARVASVLPWLMTPLGRALRASETLRGDAVAVSDLAT